MQHFEATHSDRERNERDGDRANVGAEDRSRKVHGEHLAVEIEADGATKDPLHADIVLQSFLEVAVNVRELEGAEDRNFDREDGVDLEDREVDVSLQLHRRGDT